MNTSGEVGASGRNGMSIAITKSHGVEGQVNKHVADSHGTRKRSE